MNLYIHGGYRHKTSDQLLGRAEAHSEEAGANFSTKNKKSPTAPLKIGPKYDSSVWVQLFKYSWGERMNGFIETKSHHAPSKKKNSKHHRLWKHTWLKILDFQNLLRVVAQRCLRSRRSGSWSRPWRFGSFFRWKGRGFWWMKTIELYLNSSMVSRFDTQLLAE